MSSQTGAAARHCGSEPQNRDRRQESLVRHERTLVSMASCAPLHLRAIHTFAGALETFSRTQHALFDLRQCPCGLLVQVEPEVRVAQTCVSLPTTAKRRPEAHADAVLPRPGTDNARSRPATDRDVQLWNHATSCLRLRDIACSTSLALCAVSCYGHHCPRRRYRRARTKMHQFVNPCPLKTRRATQVTFQTACF